MTATAPRKKLIEVSIPLEAINKASAREKSIRHGNPATIHPWWSRKPLGVSRAVLFAQLVDDPSAWPEKFGNDPNRIQAERRRLHKIIERVVPWESAKSESVVNEARYEIARSIAWGLGEELPPQSSPRDVLAYLQTKAPTVYDPFSGGGSIPLEAQRLGLRVHGSDLNPVAVLIGKAMIEIPPTFAGQPPVNPKSREESSRGARWNGRGAQGLAEDVRYYGRWMRDEATRRICHLYPEVELPHKSRAKVVAWLWANTVRSPDPAAKGAMVPLVSSFLLSTKAQEKAWIEPVIDRSAPDGWRFEVRTGVLSKSEEAKLKEGTIGRSSGGTCILSGASMPFTYVRQEGQTNGLGVRLMAVVVETRKGRKFLPPSPEHVRIAESAQPAWEPEGDLPTNPRDFKTPNYGMRTFASLFSARQMVTMTTFSDLVSEVEAVVKRDCVATGLPDDGLPLRDGGKGATAYAEAIKTHLALAASKMSVFISTQSRWRAGETKTSQAFARQAIPMMWGFAEINPFAGAGGDWQEVVNGSARALAEHTAIGGTGSVTMQDAASAQVSGVVVSTDPPYYDNIGYADLSDYFYVWLRRTLSTTWPDLFRRIVTPKAEELVASPYRHGGEAEAEDFFMAGMGRALKRIAAATRRDEPITIYYAFKQSEASDEGVTSAGWATFLQAIVNAGLAIDGTWPIRTEGSTRLSAKATNSLASSVVLVCRAADKDAGVVTRAEFIRILKREMPEAIDAIRKAGVGPVDMQQSVIGPGMGLFSRHARVLEDDDSPMRVKTALALINRVWEEIDQELDAAFDAETQVALAWFATFGFDARQSGELITLANAKNIGTDALFDSGVFKDLKGKTALTPREELPKGWTPATDKTLTIWECVQHTARVLNAEDGGGAAAGRLVAEMGPKAADARALAYRLFEIATQKGWAAEALIYNELAQEWPKLEDLASTADIRASTAAAQAELDL